MHEEFFNTIRNGDLKKVDRLLSSHPDLLNIKDKMGRTPLMETIIFKKSDIARFLITKGAKVNEQEKGGWTALHFAAQEFLVDVVKLLVKKDAKVDLQDKNGNTPLFRSLFSSEGRGDIINLLVSAGADKNKKNDHGVSPYDLAKKVTNYNLLQFFE